MRTVAALPQVHGAGRGMRHIGELVEDMRPFVHIFVNDFIGAVTVMVIIAGIVGAFRPHAGH